MTAQQKQNFRETKSLFTFWAPSRQGCHSGWRGYAVAVKGGLTLANEMARLAVTLLRGHVQV